MWGILSLIAGSISIIPLIILFTQGFLSTKMFSLFFCSIFGIFFGIIGLKFSKKKVILLLGIILSIIGMIGTVLMTFIKIGFQLEG